MITSVVLYNVLAQSKLMYIASFVEPPIEVILAERHAQQIITNGPWFSFSPKLMQNLSTIGFKVECRSIARDSIASRVRNALVTIGDFWKRYQSFTASRTNDGLVLYDISHPWLALTCIWHLRDAVLTAEKNGITVLGDSHTIIKQSKNCTTLAALESPFDPNRFIAHRLTRYLGSNVLSDHISYLIRCYKTSAKHFKTSIHTSHVRVILNQWCTSRRFGTTPKGCPFLCGHVTDEIEHCVICPKAQYLIHSHFQIKHIIFTLEDIVLFRMNSNSMSSDNVKYCLCYTHICYLLYNACRHGKTMNSRLVTHYIKRVATFCNGFRKFRSKVQQFGIGNSPA